MSENLRKELSDAKKIIRMYEGLFEANAAVTSSLHMSEVLNLVMEKARELLNTEAASIFLIDHKTDELVLEVSTNLSEQFSKDSEKIRFPLGKGVAGWVAKSGKPVLTDDISKDPRFYIGVQHRTGFVTRSYLCVPLKLQDKIIGTAQVMNRTDSSSFSKDDLHIMEGFARQAAIALENSRLHEEELAKKRMEEEMEQAHRIQANLFPANDPNIPGYDISGITFACRWVGGDYYDFIMSNKGNLGIAVGDVCGKGMPAAVMMSTTQAVLRSLTNQGLSLDKIVPNLNNYLFKNTSIDKFVTFFYGELDSESHKFYYINGGHNPPFLIRKNGKIELMPEGGLILGVVENYKYDVGEVHLETGDLAILYTDGVTEVHNEKGDMFGEEKLMDQIKKIVHKSARDIIDSVHTEGVKFAGKRGLDDDFTILCIKRLK